MAHKTDFAHKLLNDLRLRKERMAAARHSDANKGSSGEIFKVSRNANKMKTATPDIRSTYKSSETSEKSIAHGTTKIVPYGASHHAGQIGDLSMAIAYAFDKKGKLKALEFKSNGAMMNLLQQVGKRTMQHNPDMQQQSLNQFPTLTHLHIDEIARGAQKLKQILKACSSSLNYDKGSVEVGKELWKGAMDLEQSLRMLVSLQEASDSMVKPQQKSRLNLLEEGEESEQDTDIGMVEQKQVERPVFSFDKLSRNTNDNIQTVFQQKQKALTYPQEEPSILDKQGIKTSKGSHRRSVSCLPDFQGSPQASSSKQNTPKLPNNFQGSPQPSSSKQNTPKLPNIIAKLMGLDEIPQKSKPKSDTGNQSISSNHRRHELVSIGNPYGSKSEELNTGQTEEKQMQIDHSKESTKMTVRMVSKLELQEGKKYDPQKERLTEERHRIRNHADESKEAIYKKNQLQSRTMHLEKNNEYQRDVKELKANGTSHMQQEVNTAAKPSQKAVITEKRSAEFSNKVYSKSLGRQKTNEKEYKITKKHTTNQQKQKAEIQLHLKLGPKNKPEGKKLRADNISHQRPNNRSQTRKREGNISASNNVKHIASESNSQRKQPTVKQDREDVRSTESDTISKRRENNDLVNDDSMNSDFKEKSLPCLESDQQPHHTTNQAVQTQLNTDLLIEEKSANISTSRVEDGLQTLGNSPSVHHAKANERITRPIKTATTSALEPNLNVSQERGMIPKHTQSRQATAKQSTRITSEKPQIANAEEIRRTKHPNTYDSLGLKEPVELPTNKTNKEIKSILSEKEEDQQEVADEARSQVNEKDNDATNSSYDQPRDHEMTMKTKTYETLSEDELKLKQQLILSNLFLNTAEALFKLNIPIGILNNADDQICHNKDHNLTLDCGYELLKRKGREKEMLFYPNVRKLTKYTEINSLDSIVKQLNKDFQTLRSYGKSGKNEHDAAELILKMLDTDIYYKAPEVNCMWDLGWYETVFAYSETNDVIRDVEQNLFDTLLYEIVIDYL